VIVNHLTVGGITISTFYYGWGDGLISFINEIKSRPPKKRAASTEATIPDGDLVL
jgi:hypothetical protein